MCAGEDRGNAARSGHLLPFTSYDDDSKTFSSESDIQWKSDGSNLADDDFIVLKPYEMCDGHDRRIDLEGPNLWLGLFRIDDDGSSLGKAPSIRNLHMRNEKIGANGGFIARENQGNLSLTHAAQLGTLMDRLVVASVGTFVEAAYGSQFALLLGELVVNRQGDCKQSFRH